jgi:hypothetical protein
MRFQFGRTNVRTPETRVQSKQPNAREEKRAQIERAAVRDGLTTLATNENLVAGPQALGGSGRPNKTTHSHDTLGRPATNHPSCAGFGYGQLMQNSIVLRNCGAARAIFNFWTLGQLHAGILCKCVPHGVSYVDVATRFRPKSNGRATFHVRFFCRGARSVDATKRACKEAHARSGQPKQETSARLLGRCAFGRGHRTRAS